MNLLGEGARRLAKKRSEKYLLERWISPRESQQLSENSIMENSVTCANRRLALFERIPRNSDSRLEVVPVVVVQGWQTFGIPSDRECERPWATGIDIKGGEQIVYFKRYSIELVAQTVVQSKVWQRFEGVLNVGAELPLTESPEIVCRAVPCLVEKLCLRLRSFHTKERPDHVLQRLVLVDGGIAGGIYCRHAEVREVLEIGKRARKEVVKAIGINIPKLEPCFECVLSPCPS